MSKAAVKPAKKSFADFDMDAMDFSAVPANTEFKAAGRFQRLPLDDIDPDPTQVRREFDQAEIDALAATIKDRGLLQPIVVAPTSNGRYIIRYGERRYRACRQLGFDQIDTVLDQADAERDIGLDQFLENEQRQALSLAERVSFIASRVSDTLSTKDLAARIAKPHSEVKRLYSLRTLPEDILAALKNCSPRAAVAIKHAIELDEQATRNFVAANENPTAAACEQFLATLQGSPEEETAQAGAAKAIDDPASPKNRAPWWQLLPVRRTIVGSGLNWTLTTTSGKGRGPCLLILPITSRAPPSAERGYRRTGYHHSGPSRDCSKWPGHGSVRRRGRAPNLRLLIAFTVHVLSASRRRGI
jgi:ParB family chromosome partitioning protein